MKSPLSRVSMAHKYVIRIHERVLECAVDNTSLRRRGVHRAASIISINTFITVISQAVQGISFRKVLQLCSSGYTRVIDEAIETEGVLQYTPSGAGSTSRPNIQWKSP